MVASLPLVLVSGLVAWKAYPPPVSTPLSLNNIKLDCSEPPAFTVGYKQDEASLIPLGRGFRFQGVSWLTADVCSSGTLQLTAEGEVAGGQSPALQVALDSEILSLQNFSRRKSVTIHIPRQGRLTLGYFNDYYEADTRVATLEAMNLTGRSCRNFEVQVIPGTNNQWFPERRSASLVTDAPMKLTPCDAGSLSFQMVGRAGNKEYPVLTFQQEGKVILSLKTTSERRLVQLDITEKPLTITLANPYYKLIGDRNLNLISVKFINQP